VTFAALAGGLFVLLVVAALLVVQSKLAWRAPEHDSRYLADRSDPIRAFAQGALAAYRGNVGDPGYWKQSDALAEMTESWSTPNREELVDLLESYRRGEINLGFDKVRIIWLSRVALGCGWFDATTSWHYVAEAVQALRASYGGWEALAADIEAGAIAWNREFSTPLDADGLAWRRERVEEARRNVWPYVRFQSATFR
jgi:hypothetical protein